MRRGVLGSVSALVLLAAGVTAARAIGVLGTATLGPEAGQAHIFVAPASGGPRTTFRISFRAPATTGTVGDTLRFDTISVSGPRRPARGCVSGAAVTAAPALRGSLTRASLNPHRLDGGWCAGTFHGTVSTHVTIICAPVTACPELVIAPRPIGRFRFLVTAASRGSSGSATTTTTTTTTTATTTTRTETTTATSGSSGQTGGPAFAGLISATTCVGLLPQVQPAGVAYTLTWGAATDPVTPSSQIVYEVYESATPGGEDYAAPRWTTPPGVTSFVTPGLIAGPAYFVVRARDAAGLQDANTVEREGVERCGGPVLSTRPADLH
jgi:hypothetical protein